MLRVCYLGVGHICIVLAIIGAILPGMPTTVFLIIAAWAYGKSSERFRTLIHNHPKYGPMVCNWEQYGVIPLKAKILAGSMMALSVGLCFYKSHNKLWPSLLAITLIIVYGYILSRPSRVDLSATSLPLQSDPR